METKETARLEIRRQGEMGPDWLKGTGYPVFINGEKKEAVKAGTSIGFDLPPDEYEVYVKQSANCCPSRTIKVSLKAGETIRLLCGSTLGNLGNFLIWITLNLLLIAGNILWVIAAAYVLIRSAPLMQFYFGIVAVAIPIVVIFMSLKAVNVSNRIPDLMVILKKDPEEF